MASTVAMAITTITATIVSRAQSGSRIESCAPEGVGIGGGVVRAEVADQHAVLKAGVDGAFLAFAGRTSIEIVMRATAARSAALSRRARHRQGVRPTGRCPCTS